MVQSTVPETQLLKPMPQSLQDENQWPEFSLRDVEIYRPDHRDRPVSVEIWRAEPGEPVTVEGTLSRLPRALQKHYRSANSAPTEPQRVKIASCTHWSYGQYEDGQTAFWAAGQAGWYELRPAKWYSATHKRVKQAIELLYFVTDFYRERLKKFGGGAAKRRAGMQQVPLETMFAEYAAEPKHRCSADASRVHARFLQHAEVLVTLMQRGKEAAGWKWQDTPLFEWLRAHMAPSQTASPQKADSSEDDAMSASTSSTSRPRVSGKGRSGLRPKGTPNKSLHRGRTRSSTLASDEDTKMPDADSPSRSAKRKQEHLDSPTRRSGRVSKRLAAASENFKRPLPSPSLISSSPEDEKSSIALPIRTDYRAGTTTSHSPSLNLISTPLPNFDPMPGTDTWCCPFDGCMIQYYGVTSQPGVPDMIREHYAAHAVESQRQLDIVMREERPYLPVGNLVRHIRGLVAAENGRGNVSTQAMDAARGPDPIMQRY